MRVGATILCTDRSMRPDELAQEVEAAGLDSFSVAEHTHIPASRRTPAPMGEPLPEHYYRLLDPFVALATAAAATERIRIGTGICLVAQRDPIVTAKEVATLDLLSGGRFFFGVGYGWNADELEDHGPAFAERRDVVRERVLAMQALWRDEQASFDGLHVSFEPSYAWPKPVQQPWPKVLLGCGAGATSFAHLAEFADGWIPIGGSGLRENIPRLRALLTDAGRDPDAFEIIPFGSMPDAGKFSYFAELGCAEVVVYLPSGTRDEVMPVLEAAAAARAGMGG